jgi:Peptidase S46
MASPAMNVAYADLLKKLAQAYKDIEPYGYARDYYTEIISKIELFGIAANANSVVTAFTKDEASYKKAVTDVSERLEAQFGEYNATVDQKLFEVLMEMYVKDQKEENVSPLLKKMLAENGNSYAALAKAVYEKTAFTDLNKLKNLLNGVGANGIKSVTNDVAAALYTDIFTTYVSSVTPKLNELQASLNQLQRTYMQAQMDVFSKKTFYPDANSTLRLTYGNVKGYKARDAVEYNYYTYLDGVMEKYKPGDYEFDVPQKLIDLYNKKDFGPYGINGKQPVCFIAANHTTGGNSGSPALDGYGNLVGLNFDRVWEGTMSDINYDKTICRNIMVDIRYVLFIVDKFAGAKNIIAELKLVSRKSK